MLMSAAAARVRALEDRVGQLRFRDSARYVEDMDELRQDLGVLARELEAAIGVSTAQTRVSAVIEQTVPMPANDGPVRVPLAAIRGRNQVVTVVVERRGRPR